MRSSARCGGAGAVCAAATKLLEGTKYVTISLTLPYMYRLIEASADGMLYMPWKPAGQQWLRATQLEPEVRAAVVRPGRGAQGRLVPTGICRPVSWLVVGSYRHRLFRR